MDLASRVCKKLVVALTFVLVLTIVLTTSTVLLARGIFAVQWQLLHAFGGYAGLYSPYLDEYYCASPRACLHEQGHSEDSRLGWYSQTEEFQYALEVLTSCKSSGLPEKPFIQYVLRDIPFDSDAREIYAIVYSTVDLSEHGSLRNLLQNYKVMCELG